MEDKHYLAMTNSLLSSRPHGLPASQIISIRVRVQSILLRAAESIGKRPPMILCTFLGENENHFPICKTVHLALFYL